MSEYINNIQKPIRSSAVSMADVKNLYDGLKNKTDEVLIHEARLIDSLQTLSNDEKENYKLSVVKAYRITVVFNTQHGGQIILTNNNPFESPQLDGQIINSIHIKCSPSLGGNWLPMVAFEVFFDFSKSNLFSWNTGVSDPTSNSSAYQVYGMDDTFISTTLKKIEDFLERKKTNRNWLHAPNIYDVGLWFFAVPFSFFIV